MKEAWTDALVQEISETFEEELSRQSKEWVRGWLGRRDTCASE